MRNHRVLSLVLIALPVAVVIGVVAFKVVQRPPHDPSLAADGGSNPNNPPVFETRTAASEGWVVRPVRGDDLSRTILRRVNPRQVEGFNEADGRAIAAAAAEIIDLYRSGTFADWEARKVRLGLAPQLTHLSRERQARLWNADLHQLREAPLDLQGAKVYLRANGGRAVEAPRQQDRLGGIETWRQYQDGERYKPGDVNLAEYLGPIVEVEVPAELQLTDSSGYVRGVVTLVFAQREDGEWVPVRAGVYGIPNGKGLNAPWI